MQEADPVRGNCGSHGGHGTAQVREARRTGKERGLREGEGKKVNGVFPG